MFDVQPILSITRTLEKHQILAFGLVDRTAEPHSRVKISFREFEHFENWNILTYRKFRWFKPFDVSNLSEIQTFRMFLSRSRKALSQPVTSCLLRKGFLMKTRVLIINMYWLFEGELGQWIEMLMTVTREMLYRLKWK